MHFSIYSMLDVTSAGLLAFAGGYRGLVQGLPLAGTLVLASLAGLSGIIVRDLLLGFAAVAPLHDATYAAAAFGGALLGALCAVRHLRQRGRLWVLCFYAADSVGLAVAAAMGSSRGDVVGLAPVGCILLGMLAGCLPGVLRDVCIGDVPQAFEKHFYAVACLVTAMAALGLSRLLLSGSLAVLGAAVVGVGCRMWGLRSEEA